MDVVLLIGGRLLDVTLILNLEIYCASLNSLVFIRLYFCLDGIMVIRHRTALWENSRSNGCWSF